MPQSQAKEDLLNDLVHALNWIHDSWNFNPVTNLDPDDVPEVELFKEYLLRLETSMRGKVYDILREDEKAIEEKELKAKSLAELNTQDESQSQSQHVTEDLAYPGSQYIETQNLPKYLYHKRALDSLKFKKKETRPATPTAHPLSPESKRSNAVRVIKTVAAVKADQEHS